MSARNVKSVVSGLSVAVMLSASSAASAQEAIMLETIGAVRMAQPDEIRRMTAEQEQSRTAQAQQGDDTQGVSAR